jgi:hypothetical protein
MQGRFVGLGIEVSTEDGYVKMVSPIEDSPAYKRRHQAGRPDHPHRRHVPIKGMTLDEAIKKMRGEPGSKVVLTIARRGEDKPLVVSLVREQIQVHSVKARIIEPGYAWLRISQFQELTVEELAQKRARCTPRIRTSRAWCWTCATTRAACCPARSASRRPSCRKSRWWSRPSASCPIRSRLFTAARSSTSAAATAIRWPGCRPR